MPYYTNRQGVIPNIMPDDSPGWILVPDPPGIPEGKELIWLNWEWVVRDPKPENSEGYVWKFNHNEFRSNLDSNGWIEYAIISTFNVGSNVEFTSNIEPS